MPRDSSLTSRIDSCSCSCISRSASSLNYAISFQIKDYQVLNILRQHKQQQNMSLDKSLNLFKILYNAACEGNQSGLHWLAFHLLFQWWGNMCSAYCCLAVKMLVILTLFLPLFSAKALGMAISLGMHHGSVYIFDILCLWLRTRAMKKMFLYDTALVMDEFKLLVTRTCLRSLLHWFVIRAKAWQKAGTLTPPCGHTLD